MDTLSDILVLLLKRFILGLANFQGQTKPN